MGSRFASLSVPQIGFPRDEKEYRKEYILKAGTHFMILPLRIYEEHVVLVKTLLGLLERRLALLEWELRGKGLNRLTNNQIADCNLLHQNLVLRWQFQKHMSNAMMHWLNTTTEDPRVKNDMHLPVGWPNKNSVPLPVEWLKEKLRRQIDIFTSFGPKFEALPRRLDNLSTAVSGGVEIRGGLMLTSVVLQRSFTTGVSSQHRDRQKFCPNSGGVSTRQLFYENDCRTHIGIPSSNLTCVHLQHVHVQLAGSARRCHGIALRLDLLCLRCTAHTDHPCNMAPVVTMDAKAT